MGRAVDWCKRKWKLLCALLLCAAVITVFYWPRALLTEEVIQFDVTAYHVGADDTITQTLYSGDQLDEQALLDALRQARCRRSIDTTYSYYTAQARYEISLVTRRGPYHILLGEPDAKGSDTIMNKAYYADSGGLFHIRYIIREPQTLIALLDTLLEGAEPKYTWSY